MALLTVHTDQPPGKNLPCLFGNERNLVSPFWEKRYLGENALNLPRGEKDHLSWEAPS